MRKDPLLQQEDGSIVTEARGGLFSSIPQKNIEVVAAYLQLIIDLSSNDKEINVLNIYVNAKNIFEDDYIKSNDIYWKEHLASTLREPLDNHFEVNLLNALKHIPKRLDSEDAVNFFENIIGIKAFLNNFAHMKYKKAMEYIKSKYPDSAEITDEIFNQICKDMIDILFKWFSKHCYKGTN